MAESKLGKRYARSLFDLALEQGNADKVYDDMNLIMKTCEENRLLRLLLQNPVIYPEKKLAILKEIFANKTNKLTITFLEIIVRKRREAYLQSITSEYIAAYQAYKGIERAIVTTAIGLDDKLRNEVINIVRKSTNSEVELVEKVDKTLLGGFVLRVGDVQYDASIARSLKKLSREFISNPYIKKH
jgi:F-type H+-transporting ATPase subunit delta